MSTQSSFFIGGGSLCLCEHGSHRLAFGTLVGGADVALATLGEAFFAGFFFSCAGPDFAVVAGGADDDLGMAFALAMASAVSV